MRTYQGKQGLGTINNKMAYFFRVLRGRLGEVRSRDTQLQGNNMKEGNNNRKPIQQDAPPWAEASAPRNLISRTSPALLLIEMPGGQGEWQVATAGEADAVANPQSYLGRLLRPHCALMAIPYLSGN